MMLSNIYMLFLFEWIEMWLPFTHSICTSTWSIFFNFVLICYMVCSQYMVNRKFDLTFSADCHEKDVRERRKVKKKAGTCTSSRFCRQLNTEFQEYFRQRYTDFCHTQEHISENTHLTQNELQNIVSGKSRYGELFPVSHVFFKVFVINFDSKRRIRAKLAE